MGLFTLTKPNKKNGQIWTTDLMVAVIIFFMALIVFYKFTIDAINPEKEDMDFILQDAKLISNYLTSAGYPENWTEADVTLIGLTDGKFRLNSNKVESFSNMASTNYSNSRKLLSTTHDYYIFFENAQQKRLNIQNITSIGKNYTSYNPENIIRIERFVFYNSSIIKMVVFVW